MAILFIDIAESTKYAARRPPQRVSLRCSVRLLPYCRGRRRRTSGLGQQVSGDAALVVLRCTHFRRRTPNDRTGDGSKALRANLVELPDVDFGIGISAGLVFAGNIGSENRYEYTVIGDPVNEAPRLADDAKKHSSRTTGLRGAAVISSGSVERMHWEPMGTTLLRGRPDATETWSPR